MSLHLKQAIRFVCRAAGPKAWEVFHHIWSGEVGTPGYVKDDWLKLERELFPNGKEPRQ